MARKKVLSTKQFAEQATGVRLSSHEKLCAERMKLLLENKSGGEKENVTITITYDDKSIDLELPISVDVSEELNSKLDSIIGQNNVIIT